MRSCVSIRAPTLQLFRRPVFVTVPLAIWFALAVFVLAFADVQKFSAALVLVVLCSLFLRWHVLLHCVPLSREKERERERERERLVRSVVNIPNVFKLS